MDSQDALTLLQGDHREAEELFEKFEDIKDKASAQEKFELAQKVCGALLIHMEIEEKIFYPQVRQRIGDDDLMNESVVEHAGAKDLIKLLGELKADDPMFDSKMKVLSEQIQHHVEEEESEMFPKVRKANLDLQVLGAELLKGKAQMQEEQGLAPVAS
jgi:hemerythrin superfamily protein